MIVQIAVIPVLQTDCPSVRGTKSSAGGTERTVASKRRQEVQFIPLSLLTAAVDSSLQQSVESHRYESGKNQT